MTSTPLSMQAMIDEIAAIKTCWHTDCGYRPPPRTSPETCPCVPKAPAIAVARQVAAELPARIRWFPTGDGGLIAECFDDPPTIMFRGAEVTVIDVFADGTVWALGTDDQEHQWPSPVHMTAVANGQYIRASNDCPCPTCGRPYRQHPLLATFDWLNVLCDGTLVKL